MLLAHDPAAVREALPEADILIPKCAGTWNWNGDAVKLADELCERFQCQCDAFKAGSGRSYRDVILIGHSMGALLLRKAFVFARGENHELHLAGLHRVCKPWAMSVSRIVLLAGMNRGCEHGILYMDNKAYRRWVLKFDNPKVMSEVGAVFVTVEPKGGSDKPRGKQLLYAYLRTTPNHP